MLYDLPTLIAPSVKGPGIFKQKKNNFAGNFQHRSVSPAKLRQNKSKITSKNGVRLGTGKAKEISGLACNFRFVIKDYYVLFENDERRWENFKVEEWLIWLTFKSWQDKLSRRLEVLKNRQQRKI